MNFAYQAYHNPLRSLRSQHHLTNSDLVALGLGIFQRLSAAMKSTRPILNVARASSTKSSPFTWVHPGEGIEARATAMTDRPSTLPYLSLLDA